MPRGRVSQDLNGLASELDTFVSKALEQSALEVKKVMLDQVRRTTGGDLTLSGFGKAKTPGGQRKGAKLNVRYDFLKGSRGLGLRIRAVGHWQLIEYPRRSGYRIPKAKKPRRNPGKKLHTGHGDRGWVTGPLEGGTVQVRKPWQRGMSKAMGQIDQAFIKGFAETLRRA